MEVMPSEYKNIGLSSSEKAFAQNVQANGTYGYLLLNVNPAMRSGERMHVLVSAGGVVFFKFFSSMEEAAAFGRVMPMYAGDMYQLTAQIIAGKLCSNRALTDGEGNLKFPANIVYVFPELRRADIEETADESLRQFADQCCAFQEDLRRVKPELDSLLSQYLEHSITECSEERMTVCDSNVNSILQRIAPEYVVVRTAAIADPETKMGADNELLVVTQDDAAVKPFRLKEEQINIVNRISKGEQLILACAGAGKSVLLIAKCFKAAAMNPDKQFLITCYNRNLYFMYRWLIDQAALREKNVTCLTFHALCKKLLEDSGVKPTGSFRQQVDQAIEQFNAGRIQERYYGVFIDEVQQFNTEWYKLCYNLLENKESDDHLFVICGDKTQRVASLQRHGRAPWNAGEGYPTYRGGKCVRIDRNYRNCVEINEYMRLYLERAKRYLLDVQPDYELDPDEFLVGESVDWGEGITLKGMPFGQRSNQGEAEMVAASVEAIHRESEIPYDEIAVVMYNASYKRQFPGWDDEEYNLEEPLTGLLEEKNIPYCRMYGTDETWGARYGSADGVKLAKFESVSGLDFRAVIVCGLLPFGEYGWTKHPNWEKDKEDPKRYQKRLEDTLTNIRLLYVACTRAREILHIILPERGKYSAYIRMLEEADEW